VGGISKGRKSKVSLNAISVNGTLTLDIFAKHEWLSSNRLSF
jgi:hypothetical protein